VHSAASVPAGLGVSDRWRTARLAFSSFCSTSRCRRWVAGRIVILQASLIVIERGFSGHGASQIISAGFGLSHDSETLGILVSILRSFDFDACAHQLGAAKKVVVVARYRGIYARNDDNSAGIM
jgi:hypothetical protein